MLIFLCGRDMTYVVSRQGYDLANEKRTRLKNGLQFLRKDKLQEVFSSFFVLYSVTKDKVPAVWYHNAGVKKCGISGGRRGGKRNPP